jgi:ribonuclease D
MAMGYTVCNSTSDLEKVCADAREAGSIGLDTEFLWERTYAPSLCLAQVNVAGSIFLADPLDGVDLAPLAEIIGDDSVEVVMHAPHADLAAFTLHYDVEPNRVFDTQISAGFTGLSAGLAYDRLVAEFTGVQLPASESFSDWSKRPLGERQLQYAANDVIHLFDVAAEICDRLESLGRMQWAEEELARRFTGSDRFFTRPEEAWKKVSRRGKLSPQELGVLREVASWRERTARVRDLPVSWVMKDPTLIELARRHPHDRKRLASIRGVDSSMRDRDADALLNAVEIGLNSPKDFDKGDPPPPASVRNRVNVAKGLAATLLRARCQHANIAAELVGTSADVEELAGWVASNESRRASLGTPQLLTGWRKQFGDDLVELIDGRVAMRLTDTSPYLQIDFLDQ